MSAINGQVERKVERGWGSLSLIVEIEVSSNLNKIHAHAQ